MMWGPELGVQEGGEACESQVGKESFMEDRHLAGPLKDPLVCAGKEEEAGKSWERHGKGWKL